MAEYNLLGKIIPTSQGHVRLQGQDLIILLPLKIAFIYVSQNIC